MKGQDAEEWFKSFDRIAKASGWSDKEKGEMLPSRLKDEALRYWEGMDEIFQYDYDICRRFLIKKLGKVGSMSERISKICSRTQMVDEDVEVNARELVK